MSIQPYGCKGNKILYYLNSKNDNMQQKKKRETKILHQLVTERILAWLDNWPNNNAAKTEQHINIKSVNERLRDFLTDWITDRII